MWVMITTLQVTSIKIPVWTQFHVKTLCFSPLEMSQEDPNIHTLFRVKYGNLKRTRIEIISTALKNKDVASVKPMLKPSMHNIIIYIIFEEVKIM